ncbi:sensor histidine kinase [Cohnella endophytica]|uniref:Heme sensor protein HssS n=1 Tax=Cohnella endophytica TaxID=2419778 RepID=A0A494XYN4_9BACL|nr:sensor histidine kinase [Cohnella endophytica]
MASLILSFVVASLLYKSQIKNLMNENLIANGKKIIQAYQSTPSVQLKPFMQGVSGISNVRFQIFDPNGDPILSEQQPSMQVDAGQIKEVVSGSILRNANEGKDHHSLVGIPFQDHGKSYALFLTLDSQRLERLFQNVLETVLLSVLIIGSLLFVVAARYVVKPLQRLTHATKRMAKGKFNTRLHTKRKDEIGQLTTSFNEMAVELANLDRIRQEFVTNVSHEFQTPLTSISGFTKALKHKTLSEERRLHYLTIIEEESERLSRLSQNLLQLSHLQLKDSPLKTTSYRLDEQLRKVMITLEPLWSAKRISLEVEFEQILVQADEDQLNQVWINLLGNSLKFTPNDGIIQLTAAVVGDLLVVAIADNGPGIPAEERLDVFLPFHKADKSRDGSVKGNGLGLSIAKQIIDIHHGEIEISESSMGGCEYRVRIPMRYRTNEP